MLLYSIGYGKRENLPILDSLIARGLQLVDIRFKPYSRFAEMRQSALVEKYGVQYSHIPALGNRNYKGGPIEIVNPYAGICDLADVLRERDAVILCGCSQVVTCHRLVVANFLTAHMPETTIIEL